MKHSFMNIVAVGIVAVVLFWLGESFPDAVYRLFAYPAAFLASLFLGSHVSFLDNHEILIPMVSGSIHVIPTCSGYSFFCLLSAVLAAKSLCLQGKVRKGACIVAAFPIAYVITIIINGFRIISAYHAHQAARVFLPSHFYAAIHEGVGITLFLTALIGTALVWERTCCHDANSQ